MLQEHAAAYEGVEAHRFSGTRGRRDCAQSDADARIAWAANTFDWSAQGHCAALQRGLIVRSFPASIVAERHQFRWLPVALSSP